MSGIGMKRRPFRMGLPAPRSAVVLADGPTCPGSENSAALELVEGLPRIVGTLHQLDRLGVRWATVVVGCQAVQVQRICATVSQQLGMSLVSLRNPHWCTRGSMAALAQAGPTFEGPLLVVNARVDYSDFDLERVLAGQMEITAGVFGTERREVGLAMFRGRSSEWVGDAARNAVGRDGGMDPWWRLLNGTRGGMRLSVIRLDSVVDQDATPIYAERAASAG